MSCFDAIITLVSVCLLLWLTYQLGITTGESHERERKWRDEIGEWRRNLRIREDDE